MPVTLSLPSLGLSDLVPTSLTGEEALGRPARFEVELTASDIDPAAAVGVPALLRLGTRTVGGVVASLTADGDVLRASVLPRAFLLSLGRRSRGFERLSAPDVAAAVVATSDVELAVDVRLHDEVTCPPCTVQHRESDLDFVLRLLEREGITASFDDDGEQARVTLTDDNDALAHHGAVASAAGLRQASKMLPRRVELVSRRGGEELRAAAEVSPHGLGLFELHEAFASEQEGTRLARIAAERLRCGATLFSGAVDGAALAPGRWRVDERELVVTAVEHRLSEGRLTSRFTAVPAVLAFRPERRVPDPELPRAQEGEPAGAHATGSRPERTVFSTFGGATLELAAPAAHALADVEGRFSEHGEQPFPEVAHHTTTSPADETTTTDTWLRFGVPHSLAGGSTRKWTYLRVGEAATTTPLSVTIGTGTATFNESAGITLKLNAYTSSGLAGIYDYTDYNRTALTKGDWEEIVKGEGRLAVHADQTDPNYELRVKPGRVETTSKVPVYAFTDGTELRFMNGLKLETVTGLKVDLALGAKLSSDVGFLCNLTAGYKMDFIFADSFEYRRGEELSSSSTLDKRASEKIQFSVHQGFGNPGWQTALGAFIGLAAAGTLTGVGMATELGDTESAVMTGVSAGVLAIVFGAMRAASKERDLEDGDPILSLDKTKSMAALRSDDWLMMLSPDFAVLGKNKPYTAQKEVVKLKKADAGTAILLEEGKKVTIQADKGTVAKIELADKTITITGDTIDIKGTTADATVTITGPVTFKGDVTMDKTLKVTGETTLVAKTTVKGTEVNP